MEKKILVTIITESVLEPILIDDLNRLGAKGYTLIEAKGGGNHGLRDADWEQNRNIEVQVICDEHVASSIIDHCQKKYYSNYAMVVYLSDVQVLRPNKF